jgi:hypothetical protein
MHGNTVHFLQGLRSFHLKGKSTVKNVPVNLLCIYKRFLLYSTPYIIYFLPFYVEKGTWFGETVHIL